MNGTQIHTRGIRNSNPANIKLSSDCWLGQVPPRDSHDKTFCTFHHIDFGIRALIVLLRNYLEKGYDTPLAIIRRFSPPSENNTDAYLHFIQTFECSDIYEDDKFLKPYTHIDYKSYRFYILCAAICAYESNYKLTFSKFNNVLTHFHL